MHNTNTYWSGNISRCDVCHKTIENIFIDGATKLGPWAVMCKYCHSYFGQGLGTGKGQKYEEQTDGRWMKIDG